jgi:dethiobiotin synthetase
VTATDESSGLAVVGTDTGIGKTVVTAALVARARSEGTEAVAIKPAQTGYPEDDDAGFVQWACESEDAATRLKTYEEPLAPAVAARRANKPIQYESLLADTRDRLDDSSIDIGIVEGAGGLRVPLSNEPDREIVDLVADLGVPALVVARSGLGTLNHTALTVEALRAREIPVAGVVLNRYEGDTVAARTNPAELERMCDCSVWTLPEVEIEEPADLRELGSEFPPGSRLFP